MAADQSPTDRLKEIRERLDAAAAKDRPDCGPFTATPEGGTDPYDHELAMIFGPDGDQLGTAYGNLALGIDGDALAEMWARAPQDVAWLLGEVARLRGMLSRFVANEACEEFENAGHLCQKIHPDPEDWCHPCQAAAALEPRND